MHGAATGAHRERLKKGGGEGAMCGEGETGNRQELEGKRQEGWSDRHIMFEMSDISIISWYNSTGAYRDRSCL